MLHSARNAFAMCVVVCLLHAQCARADEVGLTGPQTAKCTYIRDYGAAGPPAAGDTVAELRHVTLTNDAPTTHMVLRSTVTNAAPGAEQSSASILTRHAGALGAAFTILGNKIGIGTANPVRTLDVAGNFAASGNTYRLMANNVNTPNHASKGFHLWTKDDARMDGQDINIIKYTYGDRTQQFAWEAGNIGHDFLYRGRSGMLVNYDRTNGTYSEPTPLVDGDSIVQMGASGRNAVGTHTPAVFLSVQVNGTPSDATVPMSLNLGSSMKVGVGTVTPKNKLDVEGSAAIGATYSGSNAASTNGLIVEGNVGVGTTSPQAKLNVNGNVLVQNGTLLLTDIATSPSAVSGRSGIFSYQSDGTSELFAVDGAGNKTRLSSHAVPPGGFDSPEVDALPWSMHHANAFIGRGQVVNMSKLVRLVEELTGNQLAYDYELPADWRLDFEKWQAEQVEQLRKDYVQRELDREPRVEVGAIEAIASATRNLAAEGDPVAPVLKPGYQRDDATGKYYRTRIESDIKAPEIAPPELPEWIKARIGSGASVRDFKTASNLQTAKTICSPESRAAGEGSVVLGGRGNMLAGDGAAIVGGALNSVVADRAVVIAGADNQAAGDESVVLGGHGNTAQGAASVASGISNRTDADVSFVGGRNMNMAASARASFVWGDSDASHTITADHAFLIFPAGGGGAAIGADSITTGTRLEVAGGDIRVTKGSIIIGDKRLPAPDYVFDPGYKLMPAEDLRAYVEANRHLPGIPSSEEIARDGIDVSRFQMRLLEKIEELTLYNLEQQKRIEKLEKQIEHLNQRLESKQ